MPRGNADIERANALKELIRDCMKFNLNTKESLVYLEARYGKKVGHFSYYKYKREIRAEESDYDGRMRLHAKIGFIREHFEAMDNTKSVIKDLLRKFFFETNSMSKAALSAQILQHGVFLYELNLSSPIIDQMRAYIDDKLKSEPTVDPTKTDNANNEIPIARSALGLSKSFIKSSNNRADDSGGIPAGGKSVDRVFEKTRKPKGETVLDT